MANQDLTRISAETKEAAFRSLLLLPVMEGNTLETEDVSIFLESRLPASEKESSQPFETPLS